MSGSSDFTSAEDWLRDRGVERQPIRVTVPTTPSEPAVPAAATPSDGRTPTSVNEASRLASEPPVAPPGGHAPVGDARPSTQPGRLEDEVARAMAFIRRSTANTPASEGRLRDKLRQREIAPAVVDEAIAQARRERLVDDQAMATALTQEWLAKGHAPFRVRGDLRKRGFDDRLIDHVLDRQDDEDPEARAFAAGHEVASKYATLEPDTQVRRLTGYLARRGHHPGLAAKVARDVVYAAREDERTASR